MLTLTREQVRQIDRIAIEELGLPGVALMENAGREVAMTALDTLEGDLHLVPQDSRVAVLCGGGNNGGDGYVAARHLANANVHVTAYAAVDPDGLSGDAAIQYRVAERMGLVVPLFTSEHLLKERDRIAEAHVLVDALLGTGYAGGEVRPHIAAVIDIANRCKEHGALIVAVDVPSGFDCDRGTAGSAVIHADTTITFIAAKTGFAAPEAELYLGRVTIGDIGVAPAVAPRPH